MSRVICHLCAKVWNTPKGQAADAYTEHYRTYHLDLEGERV